MSINLNDPKTPLEIADAISNYIEQMHLAHMMNDNATFARVHSKASELAFDLVLKLGENKDE